MEKCEKKVCVCMGGVLGACLEVKIASTPLSLSFFLAPSVFLSLGAVKIMDCHAKWPDTRGQGGWLDGVSAWGRGGVVGVIVGKGAVREDGGADRLTSRV